MSIKIQLLVIEGHADLSAKSNLGLDPLFIACQHDCLNIAFMLLHYGANSNTLNNEQETPLYWLIKHKFRQSIEIQRLLLSYNGSVLIPDLNGNNALHLLLQLNREIDLNIALTIYELGYEGGITLNKNNQDLTPSEVTIFSNFIQFLFIVFIYSFIRLFIYLFILSFFHSFIYSFYFILLF